MTLDEFKKADLRVGKVLSAERVEGSEKLLKLSVDLGEKDADDAAKLRQIIAGIGKTYEPEALVGREIVVVANLEPRIFTLRGASGQVGLESQGMLLAAHGDGGEPILLMPDKETPPGSAIG